MDQIMNSLMWPCYLPSQHIIHTRKMLVLSESESSLFPYNGCATDEIDVLCLYFRQEDRQVNMCHKFVEHLLRFPHNKTTPRVLFADVFDWYSVNNPKVNVSSWALRTSLEQRPYGDNDKRGKQQDYDSIKDMIELKVTFVQRLFSEMDGGRENVTRFSVLFIDGFPLSYEKRRAVTHNLQQQDTEIKMFAVVTDSLNENKITYLRDTLILDYFVDVSNKHLLAQAMCHQCVEGWVKLEYIASSEAISCYKMVSNDVRSNSGETFASCQDVEHSNVVTIESKQELHFLQTWLHSHFYKRIDHNKPSNFSASFFLGLIRDKKKIAKQFRWELKRSFEQRPLVVTNWLPGKPSGGYVKQCAVWRFYWVTHIDDATKLSTYGGRFVDGWADVDCSYKSSFTLCETSVPRVAGDSFLVEIKPATNESLRQASTRGELMIFEDNIVSGSFNFGSDSFNKFLEQNEYKLFPLFDCGMVAQSPRYISYSNVCDDKRDCTNAQDKYACWSGIQYDWEFSNNDCHGIVCCDGSCLLLPWVNDGEIDCPVCYSDNGENINDETVVYDKFYNRNETCAFFCNDVECIHLSQLNDGHVDCTGWEGPLDETIGKLETADTCYNQHGRRIWAPRCVYIRYPYGGVLGCRDMSHLQNCAYFGCPDGYVKCINTYCIPQHYVLDNNEDCPTGEDEQSDNIGPCTAGNYKCWDRKICLHPDLVCNGHPECPRKDDEVDCNLKCAEGFRCVSGTVTVSSYNKSVPLSKFPLFDAKTKYMDLTGVDLSSADFTGSKTPVKLIVVKWSNCNLRHINFDFFKASWQLQHLDFSYNRIERLDSVDKMFYNVIAILHLNLSFNTELVYLSYFKLDFLETLDLSHTGLSQLDESLLTDLPSLQHLDLSFTFITSFHYTFFPSSLNLQTLDLRGLDVNNVNEDFFNGLTVSQHLYTDSFEMCCPQIRGDSIPYYTCHSPINVISSCFDLVGSNVQRVVLWILSVLAVLGNVFAIVLHVVWERSSLRTRTGVFVANLCISDFIMGIYVCIVSVADQYYRDEYILYDKYWRESDACKLAGFLAILSSQMPVLLIFSNTLDRFLTVKLSLNIKFPLLGTIIPLLLTWIIVFLLALTPIVFKLEINSSNAMCNGLPLTTKRIKGWGFSFGVFMMLNFILCPINFYEQRAAVRDISQSRITETRSRTSPHRVEGSLLAKHVYLVALTNFICWCFIGIIGFLSSGGHEINSDVLSWTSVIIFPLKSGVNPIIYIILVLMDKWERFRYGGIKST